jgi:hypothetical protein
VPYWTGADVTPAGQGVDTANAHPSLDNFIFFAACIQHELVVGGPLHFGMKLLDEAAFSSYQPHDLILFTQANSDAGHAMMITGWHWCEMKTNGNKINNWSDIKQSYSEHMDDPNTKNIWQLVWTIQNQWAQPGKDNKWSDQYWGMKNNAHLAAAFYIVEKNDKSLQPVVHPIHSLNCMELNAVAGNFYPKPKPSTTTALGELVKSQP